MKLIRKILFVMIIALLLYCSEVFASTGTINVSATRLREEPNTTSEILTNIYEDESVDIVGEDGQWYKVNYNGKTGYVKKDFVKVSKSNTSKDSNTVNTSETNNNQVNNDNKTNNEVNNKTNEINNNQTNNEVVNNQTNEINNKTENSNTINNQTENTVVDNNVVSDNNNENKETTQITIAVATDLRVLPSFMSKKIGNLEAGKNVEKLAEMNNWVQISDSTIVGWVLKSKTNLVNTAEQPNPNDNANTAETNENIATNESKSNSVSNNIANDTNTVVEDNRNAADTTNNADSTVGKTGKVNVETARVREKGDSSAEITDVLDYGTTVNIISEEGDWYKIKSGNIEGYISKKLITISNGTTSRSLQEVRDVQKTDDTTINQEKNNEVNKILSTSASVSSRGGEVVETAKKYLGYSYVSGGKTPETGFDCSGFTRYVYSNFGYSLGGSAASQVSVGAEVSRDNLQVGDLILFYNEGKTKVGHTGIYMGDGNFIHAANASRGVVTDNLNTSSYYNTRFVTARRIVE